MRILLNGIVLLCNNDAFEKKDEISQHNVRERKRFVSTKKFP